jgi:NTP pyrophosphatase (non-canonical NTP hydrolase)
VVVSKETIDSLRQFVAARDWGQFHTPENLAKSISIEAGELLECFQWGSDANPLEIADELADVLTYCILLGDRYGFDLDSIVASKISKNAEKYPVSKSRGISTKYDRL